VRESRDVAVDPLPDGVAPPLLDIPAAVEAVSVVAEGDVVGETLEPLFEVPRDETAIRSVGEVA